MNANPFAGDESNPFASSDRQFPEEYNPFANDGAQQAGNYGAARPDQPAVAPGVYVPLNSPAANTPQPARGSSNAYSGVDKPAFAPVAKPATMPAYGGGNDAGWPNANSGGSSYGLTIEQREAELAAREAALNAKIAELQNKENEMVEREKVLPNWPFKQFAIVRHSISEDIPEFHRSTIRGAYFTLWMTWISLFWNFCCILATWVQGADDNADMRTVFAAIYVVMGIPGSWNMWYQTVYDAAKYDSSRRWVYFFFNYFLHNCYVIIMLIGVPQTASGGVIYMFELLTHGWHTLATLCVFLVIFWSVCLGSSIYVMRKSYRMWKSQGGKDKAEREAKTVLAQQAADGANQRLLDGNQQNPVY